MSSRAVSVIIPCYNHGRFLADAINSVRQQTFGDFEVVVVDDGSTDNTREVAISFAEVKYVHQRNRGLAAARNTGLRESAAALVSFLDADDMLRPRALEAGLGALAQRPGCAFVSGLYRVVGLDLSPMVERAGSVVNEDHYLALLRGNYVGMHATVLYRRTALESAGGYDESLGACEDYDLYLRIARTHEVLSHSEIIADYRWHGRNMSADPRFMLPWALKVLRSQRPFIQGKREREAAYRDGERFWREYYADEMLELLKDGNARTLGNRLTGWLFVLRNNPCALRRPKQALPVRLRTRT